MTCALLARHEALMASAESERFEMQSRIDQLEIDKKSLEAENARTISANRALLDELEKLNDSVNDSETHIKSLEATLASSQQMIRKLEGQETRAMELETQLGMLETEQAELQSTLVVSQAEARSALARWRQAEKGISDLQVKLERIEREANEERDRHSEMISRMEKQRNMEKDLNTAAGRLKGAAAARTIGDGNNNGVVSHFVRDLLADNANLQLGIAELREMLISSNDEIQMLREQLIFHQPAEQDEVHAANTLRAELAPEETYPKTPLSPRSVHNQDAATSVSQELHIHHHYHVTKPAEQRKPVKKKRQHLTPNAYASPRPFSPGPSSPWRLDHRATSPSLVAHSVKDSFSTLPSTRWSVFSDQPPSDFAPSSVPSSPMSSHHRRVSVFDRDYENVAPTSPTTSVDPASPAWTRQHRSQKSADAFMRNFSTPRPLYLGDVPEDEVNADYPVSPRCQYSQNRTPARDHTPGLTDNTTQSGTSSTDVSPDGAPRMPLTPSFDDSYDAFKSSPRPRLRRAASQESIVSLTGGLEIHTLQARPSQLALKPLGVAAMAAPQASIMVARPTIARGNAEGKRGSIVLRDNLLSLPNLRAEAAATPTGQSQQRQASGLGRFVSRLWSPKDTNATPDSQDADSSVDSPSERGMSVSPSPTTQSPGSSIMEGTSTTNTPILERGLNIETPTTKKPPPKDTSVLFSPPRTFGINQPGAIPGFSAFWAAHQRNGPVAQVVPRVVDAEALREAVEEG
ncbi:hypothetical protein N0V82_002786 [Gnomoniopsis sp. IMI 355080]|nr:hypothetical protein N0V82_002786 [Gnomoniopsis sp. IMI 355080]